MAKAITTSEEKPSRKRYPPARKRKAPPGPDQEDWQPPGAPGRKAPKLVPPAVRMTQGNCR